jgi:hypothetical protein
MYSNVFTLIYKFLSPHVNQHLPIAFWILIINFVFCKLINIFGVIAKPMMTLDKMQLIVTSPIEGKD